MQPRRRPRRRECGLCCASADVDGARLLRLMTQARLTAPPPEVLAAFGIEPPSTARVVADGHINDSMVVQSAAHSAAIFLQRINHHVFVRPDLVQENIVRVTDHLRASRDENTEKAARGALEVLSTRRGASLVRDDEGWTWRAFRYIEGSRTKLRVTRAADALTAARAYGDFQRRLADFDVTQLHETIPGFHDTPSRFDQLAAAASEDRCERLREVRREFDALWSYEPRCRTLVELTDVVPCRVVHNDAKLSNVLLEITSGEALCVIDLDTVMPGQSLCDFGEMVRSMAHRTPEDDPDPSRVHLEPELYRAIVSGYLGEVGDLLTETEREHLFDAAQLMVLENGVRFLTDYLAGDVYFRIKEPEQNLRRARTHIALLASLASLESELRQVSPVVLV